MADERILIVDDEASVRAVICAFLERAGYRVFSAASAAEALTAMQHHQGFELVIADIMMPGMDGFKLLDRVFDSYPGTPIVFITAIQDIHVATNAFRRGATDYLMKPFSRADLETVVARALEQGLFRRQNARYRQSLDEIAAARTERLRTAMNELEQSYDITIQAMGNALDLRDEETEGHSRRVTAYSIALARACGLQGDDLRTLARGAFLHDIGKISTPDAILLKPGKLSPEETVIMREHCMRGYEIVGKIPFLRDAAEIVLTHQECFDGSGYPHGLSGDDIPLGARIFAIADTFDAITSDRPYRMGKSFEEARQEILRCAGRQFDPEIVKIFCDIPSTVWQELRDECLNEVNRSVVASLCRPEPKPLGLTA